MGALALLAAGVPASHAATIAEPHTDPFYAPPAGYEQKSPGSILRTRMVKTTGLGIPLPVTSTQALVRSTDSHGKPMAIVTTLLVPKIPSAPNPRPLLSYQPAIDSLGDQCQPSYQLQTGDEAEIPLFLPALLRGWAVVVTDYQGPRNAFAAGRMEGNATLDGIRAALHLPGSGLTSKAKVGIWGYSGGSLASGWAVQNAPVYAPELNIVGAALGGTPADLYFAGKNLDGGLFAGLFLTAALGVSREYPEVLALLNDKGRALAKEFGDLCVAQSASRHSFAHLADYTNVKDPLNNPIVKKVLDANKMGERAPKAPVYLYHGYNDELIPWNTAAAVNTFWCSKGARVRFVTDYTGEHISTVATGSVGAFEFLMERVGRNAPASSTCF